MVLYIAIHGLGGSNFAPSHIGFQALSGHEFIRTWLRQASALGAAAVIAAARWKKCGPGPREGGAAEPYGPVAYRGARVGVSPRPHTPGAVAKVPQADSLTQSTASTP
jgi:hypothetical protein